MSRSRTVLYEESQSWALWVSALVWVSALGAAVPLLLAAAGVTAGDGERSRAVAGAIGAALLLLPVAIQAAFGSLVVRVTSTSVTAQLGRLGLLRATFPFTDIRIVEVARYRPLRDFGGWGYRKGRGGRTAWTIRGDRAVVLHGTDDRLTYLGSATPERLRASILAAAGGRLGAAAARGPRP